MDPIREVLSWDAEPQLSGSFPGRDNSTQSAWRDQFCTHYHLDVLRPEPWNRGRRIKVRVCPFNEQHTNSACLIETGDGAYAFRCLHNSCADKSFHSLREHLEQIHGPMDSEPPKQSDAPKPPAVVPALLNAKELFLVLLCYKRRAQQNGQWGSWARRKRATSIRRVAMEVGLCRSARARRTARFEGERKLRGA
jgi:hypothetical protein